MKHARGIAIAVTVALMVMVTSWAGAPALAQQQDTINLSHDLVRLGIAAANVQPDDPSVDSRPLFQAALAWPRIMPSTASPSIAAPTTC